MGSIAILGRGVFNGARASDCGIVHQCVLTVARPERVLHVRLRVYLHVLGGHVHWFTCTIHGFIHGMRRIRRLVGFVAGSWSVLGSLGATLVGLFLLVQRPFRRTGSCCRRSHPRGRLSLMVREAWGRRCAQSGAGNGAEMGLWFRGRMLQIGEWIGRIRQDRGGIPGQGIRNGDGILTGLHWPSHERTVVSGASLEGLAMVVRS